MSEDWSRGKGLLQEVESGATIVSEFPRSVFAGKPCERNNNVRVVVDESTVEVHESEEGLDVLHLPWFWPIRDGLNFLCRHGKSVRGKTETQVLSGSGMEFTFLWLGKEIVFLEASKDFVDVFLMGLEVLGEIHEDAIDKSLESHGSICQAKGHDIPLEGPIPCVEHGFPFITFCNADQVVHVVEINLRVDLGLARGIEEV
ncbi:hypothetical protein SCLCIDRAFT_134350 [Scleroderma citrinum Foug A]|uniref:Uncharacterized protein n=1 Tax=Scleroderma citrinum Foug A TaxID=1036808 RepID=A0A0C3D486_9AGAM|nr:hypothetical protein SCLCIDRAFT_134350 [Scleroderma citrinum Foug A]